MQRMILMIMITIQILVPPMPPAPTDAKQPEPVFTKEQPPVCRRWTRNWKRPCSTGQTGNTVRCAVPIFSPAPTALNTARTAPDT